MSIPAGSPTPSTLSKTLPLKGCFQPSATPNSFSQKQRSSASGQTAPTQGSTERAAGDSAGIWQKWLSRGGVQATPEEVKMFLGTLVNFFTKVIFGKATRLRGSSLPSMEKDVIEGRK